MTTILLQVTLSGDLDDYELQQQFLERLPERYGRRVEMIDARIVAGLVDKDSVPIQPSPARFGK
jgi:hypothetical protein